MLSISSACRFIIRLKIIRLKNEREADRSRTSAKLSHGQAFSFLIQPRFNCSTRVSWIAVEAGHRVHLATSMRTPGGCVDNFVGPQLARPAVPREPLLRLLF